MRYLVEGALGGFTEEAPGRGVCLGAGEQGKVKIKFSPAIEDFNNEVEVLRFLEPTGRFPRVLESPWPVEDGAVLVTTFADHPTLLECLLRDPQLFADQKAFMRLALKFFSALEEAHRAEAPVAVRDIKPGNVVIEYELRDRLPRVKAVHFVDMDAAAFVGEPTCPVEVPDMMPPDFDLCVPLADFRPLDVFMSALTLLMANDFREEALTKLFDNPHFFLDSLPMHPLVKTFFHRCLAFGERSAFRQASPARLFLIDVKRIMDRADFQGLARPRGPWRRAPQDNLDLFDFLDPERGGE